MSRRSARRIVRLGSALVSRRRSARLAFTTDNGVRLFSTGDDYFAALIAAIDGAEHDVVLETYIFCDDAAGGPVSDALVRAAMRGVRVRIITDGIGTARLALFAIWREAGVEHRIFNPHLFGRFGFSRTHRKIAAVDGRFGFCGGINIVDDYDANGMRLPFPRWDFALGLTGPVVGQIVSAFDVQWQRVTRGYRTGSLEALRPRAWLPPSWAADRGRRKTSAALGEPAVAFVARDNIVNRRAIEKAYLVAIGRARDEILLANPYFMPGRKIRRALVRAARRGVDVRILVGRNEFVSLDYAVPHLYGMLLAAGAKIGEYERTMLHAKVAVVDSSWATVGSSNLDALSLVLNHEANAVLVAHPEIAALRSALLAAFDEARPIDPARYAARPRGERFVNWLSYTVYRAVMKLITVGSYD